MITLLCFFLTLLVSPFKSKSRLEAENAALRAHPIQNTEAFPWSEAPRYLIRDQDGIYGAAVTRRLRAMGIRDKPIAPSSPWQNAFAERLIGSIRRECVDHMVVLGEAHLRRVLNSYARYYNESRIHRSLSKDAPFPRANAQNAHRLCRQARGLLL